MMRRPSSIHKYSVEINGRTTSISLEPQFYEDLRAAAAERQITLSELIGDLDKQSPVNLSSELRLYVLDYWRKKQGDRSGPLFLEG